MDEFDQVSPDGPVLPPKPRSGRVAAVERGRKLGLDEAHSRGEVGAHADERVNRAMAYAAWDHDGRPGWFDVYRAEFGVAASRVGVPSVFRGPDPKGGKK